MNDFNVTFTAREREYLVWLLQATLEEARVEQRHTDNVAFKNRVVVKEEDLLRALLAKFQSAGQLQEVAD